MSLVVNHNMMAANVANNLNTHYSNLSTSTQRLSTGLRINSAADDAAGLAIRELQRADIAALHQGARNANDAISLIQVADGALSIIDEKLIRMKELAEQAATGTYDSTQRLMIESEYQAMAAEITRIANATDFNGIHLLNGSLSATKHDGSGLNSTGKLKIHFGSGNDSAEDYYYIQIGECTAQAFGLGNNSTWEDVLNRLTISFGTQLEESIDAISNDSRYSTELVTWIKTASQKWVNDFNNGMKSYTEFNNKNDLQQLYNNFQGDSNINNLSSEFEYYINNYNEIDERVSQKLKYALGLAATNALKEQNGPMKYFGSTAMDYIAPGVNNGYLSNTTPMSYSAITSSGDGTNKTFNENGSFVYAPPIDYDPSEYDTSTYGNGSSTAPINYPLQFSSFDTTFTGRIEGLGGHFYKMNGTELLVENSTGAALGDNTLIDDISTILNDTLQKSLRAAATEADKYNYAGYTIATQEDAQKSLEAINDAIVEKDKIRAHLGATQNRLENTISNLNIQAENLQAAESRISDVDVSTEMTEFVRQQILTQSAVAMLSQANSMPQMAMQIIGG